MQKLKLNANVVGGAAHSDPLNKNGITLIALIITIIVMLILVGVTINVALNGGLFQKAETATRETEEKAILEEMLAMMEITDDGKINAQAIIDKIKEKYTVEGSIPNITITGNLGKYNYVVSEDKIKIGETVSTQGIEYALIGNSYNGVLQKIDYNNFTVTTYNINNGEYSKDPSTPRTFELGEATTENLEIIYTDGVELNATEIQKGAIPAISAGIVAGYIDGNVFYMMSTDDYYFCFELITDELQIEEFENAIANIE